MKKKYKTLLWTFISVMAITSLMIWVVSIQTEYHNSRVHYMEADMTTVVCKHPPDTL